MRRLALMVVLMSLVGISTTAQWQRPQQLIIRTDDGTVYLANGTTLDALILPEESTPTCVTLSADETRLLYRRTVDLEIGIFYIYDLATRESVQIAEIETFGCPAWTPDDTAILYRVRDGDRQALVWYDLASGEISSIGEANHRLDWAWSPDGERLAVGGDDILIHDPETGTTTNITQTPDINEFMPQWSPDGDILVFQDGLNQSIYVYQNGETREIFPEAKDILREPQISPDGNWVGWEVLGDDNRSGIQIALYDLRNDAGRFIESPPNTLLELNLWLPQSDGVIFRRVDILDFTSELLTYDLATEYILPLTDDRNIIEANFEIAPDDSAIIYQVFTINTPGDLKRQPDIGRGLADIALYDFETHRQLTDTPDIDERPISWSPDSRTVVLQVREGDDEAFYLALLDVESGTVTPLTNTPAQIVAWLGR